MKIGDKVRFLSEQGGGRITGFQGKNIVLVEDADGFEIPFQTNEVVVVDDDNYERSPVVRSQSAAKPKETVRKKIEEEKPITFKMPVEERKGGDRLSVYLAFVPIDIKEISRTKFESYIVNDCNYYVRFTYLSAENNCWRLRYSGEIEPNTKLFIEEFERDILNELDKVCVQLIAYKRDKSFILKPAIESTIRIDKVKFYKLHTFRENDFFEMPALIYPIVENDTTTRPLVVDAKQLKEEFYSNKSSVNGSDNSYVRRYEDGKKHGNPFVPKHRGEDILVVDLHASELLDTTLGMKSSEILNYQLDVFRKTLAENKNKKGKKIVFIHGKGEGVLRQAIINELKYKYKQYSYQDASFQEYGYGATQITVH